ncbi:hypothetical protein [Streptomyces sp. NRRL F-5727]|uniref:hypothetical protein n=1 Tax=Streptomyces sp. NRRL F-5727 TaxID=1463871 RepID=UPI0004CB2075|nr:hypothetical protein [Streptomyces sp. NRRL F-5727]
MSSSTATSSRTLLAALLAALAIAEVVVVTGDASDGVRYGGGAVLAVAILAVVYRLSKGSSAR